LIFQNLFNRKLIQDYLEVSIIVVSFDVEIKIMREILFRGKRIDNGEWVVGYYFAEHEMPKRGDIGYFIKVNLNESHQVAGETVGQFWFAKNGEWYFEGDIVSVKGRKRIGKYHSEIVWYDNGFRLKRNDTYFIDGTRVAIISKVGTIHENPELINNPINYTPNIRCSSYYRKKWKLSLKPSQ
jgi:hypothetical protein